MIYCHVMTKIYCFSLVFRGDKNDSAVMCTKNKTYELKTAEISNSLVVLPDILWNDDICSSDNRILCDKQVKDLMHS